MTTKSSSSNDPILNHTPDFKPRTLPGMEELNRELEDSDYRLLKKLDKAGGWIAWTHHQQADLQIPLIVGGVALAWRLALHFLRSYYREEK